MRRTWFVQRIDEQPVRFAVALHSGGSTHADGAGADNEDIDQDGFVGRAGGHCEQKWPSSQAIKTYRFQLVRTDDSRGLLGYV